MMTSGHVAGLLVFVAFVELTSGPAPRGGGLGDGGGGLGLGGGLGGGGGGLGGGLGGRGGNGGGGLGGGGESTGQEAVLLLLKSCIVAAGRPYVYVCKSATTPVRLE